MNEFFECVSELSEILSEIKIFFRNQNFQNLSYFFKSEFLCQKSEFNQKKNFFHSSFAGGSQPVLNTNTFTNTKERCHTVDSSSERLEEEEDQQQCTESSTDTINGFFLSLNFLKIFSFKESIQKHEQEVADLLQFMDGPFMMPQELFGGDLIEGGNNEEFIFLNLSKESDLTL